MSKAFEAFKNLFKFHKTKLFIVFTSIIFFGLLFFPFNDLGSFVATQVAKASNNSVLLKFDDISLSMIPQPGLKLTNVIVHTSSLPPLKAKELTVSPSLIGLLTFKPGISVTAEDLLNGDVSVSIRGGEKKENGVRKQLVSLTTSAVNLQSAISLFADATGINGKINLDIQGSIDPQFIEQPDLKTSIRGEKVQMISYSIPTMLGPFKLPDVSFKTISIHGKYKNGSYELESAELGTEQDNLFAKLKGRFDIVVRNMDGQISFEPKSYDFTVQILAKNSFKNQAEIFLTFINKFQSPSNSSDRTEYLFRIASSDIRAPPNMTAVTNY